MRAWIMGILCASLMSAAAMALCPDGRVRNVTRMACGLVCALAVASPLTRLDMGSLAAGIAAYERQAQKITQNAEDEEKMLERAYIEERYAAYILAEAAQAGIPAADVSVLARWDDGGLVWYPWEVTVTGAYDAHLSAVIEAQLGVPAGRQHWNADG